MFFSRFLSLAAPTASLTTAVELPDYDYVVIGSGAGGGPLAARLALAGHKTLLIEAGDDQGLSVNLYRAYLLCQIIRGRSYCLELLYAPLCR